MNLSTSVISLGTGAGLLRLRRPDRLGLPGGAISLSMGWISGRIRWQRNTGPGLACGLLAAALLSPVLSHGQGASKANADQDAAAKGTPTQAAPAASGSQPAKNADALYSQALGLENEGNVVDAVKLYEQAARGGSAVAAKRLGDIYKTGKGGVARDAQTSLKYYNMAKQGITSGKDKEPKEEPKAGPEKAKAEQEAADTKAAQEAAAARNKMQQETAAKAKAEQESAAAKAREQEAAAARARSQQEAAAKAKADQDAAAKAPPAQVAPAASGPQPAKNADALYSQALGLENQGNVVDAVKLYEQAARGGSAAAAKKLGDIYKTGKGGVARDAQASLKYYAMAKQGVTSGKDKEPKEEPKAGADKAKAEQEAAVAKAAQEAAVAKNKSQQEAAAKARAEQESAAARAREQADAAAKVKAQQEAAAKARADQEAAAKAKAEQESAAAKARSQQEAAAKARAEQEAAAKAKAEQESTAAKARETREQAAAAAKAQQEAAAKAKADQEAAAKAPPTQVASAASGPQPAKNPDALYSQGLALEEQGNVLEAVKLYDQAVKAGSGPAAKKLGEIYGKGKGGVVRDGQASLKYFALARQRGEAVR